MYQISGGRLGSILPGHLPVLLLTTIGRRSGLARTHPLGHLTVEDGYLVIASNVGEPPHPAWYHNLKANPEATVQAGTHRVLVRAREARGEERAQIWVEVVERDPSYAVYQDRTSRLIPLMVLEIQESRRPSHTGRDHWVPTARSVTGAQRAFRPRFLLSSARTACKALSKIPGDAQAESMAVLSHRDLRGG